MDQPVGQCRLFSQYKNELDIYYSIVYTILFINSLHKM